MHDAHGHDVLLWAAAGVLAAGPVLAAAMARWNGWIFLGPARGVVTADRALRPALAVLALGAAAIHITVLAEHYLGVLLAGVLIVSAAGFGLVSRPLLAWLALALNAAVIVSWSASQAIGLDSPIGGARVEPVHSSELVAVALQVVLVAGLAICIRGRDRLAITPVSTRSGSLATISLAAGVLVLAIAAVTQDLAGHH